MTSPSSLVAPLAGSDRCIAIKTEGGVWKKLVVMSHCTYSVPVPQSSMALCISWAGPVGMRIDTMKSAPRISTLGDGQNWLRLYEHMALRWKCVWLWWNQPYTTFMCGDTAFIFGGRSTGHSLNDLHTLDMVCMHWNQVHPSLTGIAAEGVPVGRGGHSMTQVSSDAAALFGGGGDDPHSPFRDCWLLKTGMVLRGKFERPSSLRERCEQHELSLINRAANHIMHSAVVEPISKRLWILGGFQRDVVFEPRRTTEVLPLTFNSGASLKLLAMESAPRHFRPGHPILEDTELPRNLRLEFKHYFH